MDKKIDDGMGARPETGPGSPLYSSPEDGLRGVAAIPRAAKERPILFSASMVRALLEGRKTQTRRIVKLNEGGQYVCHAVRSCLNPDQAWQRDVMATECPFGKPGDWLWVRETHAIVKQGPEWDGGIYIPFEQHVLYAADASTSRNLHFRPSVHMPRWASRITLEVVSVRVERLQDISEEDAKAEGISSSKVSRGDSRMAMSTVYGTGGADDWAPTARMAFEHLWEGINGRNSWEVNPWVWVVEFRVRDRNEEPGAGDPARIRSEEPGGVITATPKTEQEQGPITNT